MKLVLVSLIVCSSIFSIDIEVITTNDLHGNIAPQKAWFMNPSFPPDIIGGAGLLKYVNENNKKSDSEVLIFDAGNFFKAIHMECPMEV